MASIRENRKDGKLISYTFTACFGRDKQGKQIRRYTTWTPPKGMGATKARKEAEKQAILWEQSLQEEVEQQPTVVQRTIDERQDDFVEFIEKVWFPLQVSGNDRKAKTVAFYTSTTKIIKKYFTGRVLQEITAMDIDNNDFCYGNRPQKAFRRRTHFNIVKQIFVEFGGENHLAVPFQCADLAIIFHPIYLSLAALVNQFQYAYCFASHKRDYLISFQRRHIPHFLLETV